MPSASAANIDSQIVLQRFQAALQSADHARGNAGGMPVHPHHSATTLLKTLTPPLNNYKREREREREAIPLCVLQERDERKTGAPKKRKKGVGEN